MQPEYVQYLPYLFVVLAVFAIYRRLRRNFGAQPLMPGRMRVRIGFLILVGLLVLPAALKSTQYLAAEIAGLAAGVALGVWGAARTGYFERDGRLFYVPHTYTGLVVSLLFMARLAYRVFDMMMNPAIAPGAEPGGFPGGGPPLMRSPLTLGLLFVVVGYYVYFYSKVLYKSKHIVPEDLETVPGAGTAGRT